MKLKAPMLAALAAALLTTTLVVAAGAQAYTPEQLETFAKLREIKRRMIMFEGQQHILQAWQAKHPNKKLPRGLRIVPERGAEGGLSKPARQPSSSGPSPAAPQTGPVAAAFGSNLRVNNPLTDVFTDAGQSETSVASLGSNVLVTWNDGDGFDRTTPNDQLLGYGYSTNGGASWTDGGQLPQLTSAPGSAQFEWTSDPAVTVNETTGDYLMTGLVFPNGMAGTTNGVAFVKGTFSGPNFTWGTPKIIVSANNSVVFYDKQWVAVDPANSNIYVSFTKFTLTGDEIDFSRSTDGGTTWSAPVKVSPVSEDGLVQGSRVAVGPNSEVYVTWSMIGPTDKDFFKMKKSVNGGTSFGVEVQSADYYANFSSGAPGFNREKGITYPGLAVDRTQGPNRGRVYTTWNESINYYANDLGSPSTGNISEPEGPAVFGQNDNATRAVAFVPGNTVRGTISDINNDFDFYKFNATQGSSYVFFVDSLDAGLDMAFRLLCADSVTRLAISSPGKGLQNLIVWTCPVTGLYYIRPAAWVSTSDPGPLSYRIHTAVHTPIGSDRARDQRDIFVASSSDGLTWPLSGTGAPVRVNDDQPFFDNWLPEVAVTGNSRVFCTWFDWRDSAPAKCGGESNLYLYRSSDAGATWSNLGLITDASTNWTNVASNVAPNQGDYIALFANQTTVLPCWGDGRDGNPNVYIMPIPTTTPAQVSLSASRVAGGTVELEWLAIGFASENASLERSEAGGGWTAIQQGVVAADGRIAFADAGVAAGRSYDYRLAFADGTHSDPTRVTVPSGFALALGRPQPNPAVRDLWLSITLPDATPATLSMVDIAGRIVRSREVGSLGVGIHRVNLGEGGELPAGVYVIRLQQGGRTLTTRASVIR